MNNKRIYGLIGKSLGHSFSRQYFNNKFLKEGINAEYVNFELPDIVDFPAITLNKQVCGLNVTIPYKSVIMPLLDEIDDTARAIGAVNVIKLYHTDNATRTKGFNSDYIGFRDSIRPLLTHHRQALILGTGGASLAVAYALRQLGINVQFVSRTAKDGILSYGQLTEEIIRQTDIIVNTTPLGMFPDIHSCPDIPYTAISSRHLCYDLTYNPEETLFLQKAKQQGAAIINGEQMLINQAIESWKIWHE